MNEKFKKIFVIFLLLTTISGLSMGVLLFGLDSGGDIQKYNGIKFRLGQNSWFASINKVHSQFAYLPQETEQILIEGDPFDLLESKVQIDVTYDINSTISQEAALAAFQMAEQLQKHGVFVRRGFTAENEYNFPEIHCENSTGFAPVIYFKEGNTTKISLENSCAVVETARGDAIRAKERIVYGILGVIK